MAPQITPKQLEFIALAASFAPSRMVWKATTDWLIQAETCLLNGERILSCTPSLEPVTKDSLQIRITRLDEAFPRTSRRELLVEGKGDVHNEKFTRSLLMQIHSYSNCNVPIARPDMDGDLKENDILVLGVVQASMLCREMDYLLPNLREFPVHAILLELLRVIHYTEAPGHLRFSGGMGRVPLLGRAIKPPLSCPAPLRPPVTVMTPFMTPPCSPEADTRSSHVSSPMSSPAPSPPSSPSSPSPPRLPLNGNHGTGIRAHKSKISVRETLGAGEGNDWVKLSKDEE